MEHVIMAMNNSAPMRRQNSFKRTNCGVCDESVANLYRKI